jgi:hypothetical protein
MSSTRTRATLTMTTDASGAHRDDLAAKYPNDARIHPIPSPTDKERPWLRVPGRGRKPGGIQNSVNRDVGDIGIAVKPHRTMSAQDRGMDPRNDRHLAHTHLPDPPGRFCSQFWRNEADQILSRLTQWEPEGSLRVGLGPRRNTIKVTERPARE